MVEINYVAVVVAGVAAMVVGFLWYGPVFGKQWMALMGMTPPAEKPAGMNKLYAIAFVGALLTAYVMAHFVELLNVSDMNGAVELAFWAWAGFMVPLQMSKALWESRSWTLVGLNAGHDIVQLAIVTSILATWMW